MSDSESDSENGVQSMSTVELFTHAMLQEQAKEPLDSFTSNKTLKLCKLGIRKLEDFTELEQLSRLDLSNNFLESLRAISSCTKITTLNVSHNHLSGKGLRGIVTMENLVSLNASYNRIKKMPEFIFENIKHLKALILNNNSLKEMNFIKNLVELNTLILSHNNLDDLSLEDNIWDNLMYLRKLSLSYNAFTSLSFPILSSLHELNLSHNQLTTIDDSITKLPKLFLLDISYNDIENIEELNKLKEMKSLHQLICVNNPFMTEDINKEKISEILPQLNNINREVLEDYNNRKLKRKQHDEDLKTKSEEIKREKREKVIEKKRGFTNAKLEEYKAAKEEAKKHKEVEKDTVPTGNADEMKVENTNNKTDLKERKVFPKKFDNEKKPFKKYDGEKKPFKKFDGEKKPFKKFDGEKKPFKKFDGSKKPFNKKFNNEKKPFNKKFNNEKKPFNKKFNNEKKPFNKKFNNHNDKNTFKSNYTKSKPIPQEKKPKVISLTK
ncbi:hypothetical protein WA158_006762 [Blastocystis sp. Blastoise]